MIYCLHDGYKNLIVASSLEGKMFLITLTVFVVVGLFFKRTQILAIVLFGMFVLFHMYFSILFILIAWVIIFTNKKNIKRFFHSKLAFY